MNDNRMTRRAILVTFDGLPSLSLHADDFDSQLADLLAELSTSASYFENHYLAQPHQLILSAAGKSSDSVPESIRELWICTEDDSGPSADGVRTVQWSGDELPEDGLEWVSESDFIRIHVAVSVSEETLPLFQTVLLLCEALTDDSTIIGLTGTAGTSTDSVSMESLMWESEIRVPLWIRIPGQEAARVQTLTTSADLVTCIQEWMNDVDVTDLRILKPAEAPPAIIVQTASAVGVRTPEFLFVRQPETDSADEQTALYVKPEDVWNVNDVSAEYIEAAERLDALCPRGLRETSDGK